MALNTVEVLLDRPRQLRFTIMALRDLQRSSGMALAPFAAQLSEASIEGYVMALAAGLKHEIPRITLDQAAELLQMALDQGRPLMGIAEKITEAFVASGLFEAPKNAMTPGTEPPPAGEPKP